VTAAAATPAAPPAPWVTRSLLAINVAVFLAMVLSGVPVFEPGVLDLIDWGATIGPLTVGHQWWRLGTSMFLHIGLLHLALNMLCLASLGRQAEGRFGRRSFLAGYLLAGIGGAITSVVVHTQTVGAGASGAIFGVASRLLTAGWVGGPTGDDTPVINGRLGSFLMTNLAYGFIHPGIDNSAHIGGLLTGAVLGLFAHRRVAQAAWRGTALVALGLATVAALLGQVRTVSGADYAALTQEVAESRAKEHAARARESSLRSEIGRLEQTIERRPDSAAAYLALARAYAAFGDNRRAEQRLRQGIQHAPGDPTLHAALGAVTLNFGQVESAVAAYEAAFRLDSSNAEVRQSLADVWQRRGRLALEAHDTTRALESFRRALAVAGDSAQIVATRGWLRALEEVRGGRSTGVRRAGA
jgi:rhomboid protease GluP